MEWRSSSKTILLVLFVASLVSLGYAQQPMKYCWSVTLQVVKVVAQLHAMVHFQCKKKIHGRRCVCFTQQIVTEAIYCN